MQPLGETNPTSLTVGGIALAVLVLGKIYPKSKPVALFVVVGGILASHWLGLDARGVKLRGTVPQGLPPHVIPDIHWADLNDLLPLAFACLLIGAVETAAIVRDTIAERVPTEATPPKLVVLDLSAAAYVDMHSALMLAELSGELTAAGIRVQAVEARSVDFGKQQLDLMLRENYLHPNGQIPAYEWNFGDVNPPVHPWASIFRKDKDGRRPANGGEQKLQEDPHWRDYI